MTTAVQTAARHEAALCEVRERALRLWPGLDPRSLSRCGCDPDRIADFVALETRLPVAMITGILAAIERAEPPFYFG